MRVLPVRPPHPGSLRDLDPTTPANVTSRSIHPSRWLSSTREGSRLRVDVDVQDGFQSSRSKFILISFSGSPLVSVIRLRRVSDLRACLQTTSQLWSPTTPPGSHPPPTCPPHQPTGSSLARKPRNPHGRRPSSTESTFLFLTASHQSATSRAGFTTFYGGRHACSLVAPITNLESRGAFRGETCRVPDAHERW